MAFELRDFRDLVQLLRQHPEWQEELRALLLTQELLTLPALVRELAATVNQLAEQMVRLTDRVDHLTERLDRLTDRVDQLVEQVAQLTAVQKELVDQVGDLRGWRLEERYRTHPAAYFGRLLRRVRLADMSELADALREQLAEDELGEVLLADVILSGRLLGPAEPAEIWVVVEVSATVDRRDVERAQQRAALLRRARYSAVAVAGGIGVTAGARQAAGGMGVALLLDGRVEGWPEALAQAQA